MTDQSHRPDGDGLRSKLIEFDRFLNEPPPYEDKTMVRDYRHSAYAKWSSLCIDIVAMIDATPTRDGAEGTGDDCEQCNGSGRDTSRFNHDHLACPQCRGTGKSAPPKPAPSLDTNSVADSTGSEPGTPGASKEAGGHSRGDISPASTLSLKPARDAMREASKVHRLKTWPEYFEAILTGKKSFEWRVADRSFAVGDTLILQEWKPERENYKSKEGAYTGREIERVVMFLFTPPPLNERAVVMSIAPPCSAPVRPADGAGIEGELTKLMDASWPEGHREMARKILSRFALIPSGAGAAEPVAWECTDERYRYICGIVTTRAETVEAWREGGIKFTPLVRALSVQSTARPDRGTFYTILKKYVPQDATFDALLQDLLEADGVQSGAGEREDVCPKCGEPMDEQCCGDPDRQAPPSSSEGGR